MWLHSCRYSFGVTYAVSTGTVTLYINGGVDTTCTGITINPATLPALSNAYVGKSGRATDPYLTGKIKGFRLYTGALT